MLHQMTWVFYNYFVELFKSTLNLWVIKAIMMVRMMSIIDRIVVRHIPFHINN